MVLLLAILLLYTLIYPKVSRLVVNNMCMLFVHWIYYDYKAFIYSGNETVRDCRRICGGESCRSGCNPQSQEASEFKKNMLGRNRSLAAVIVTGRVSYGAKLGTTVAGISIQPSEACKDAFVFLSRPV